MQRAQRLIAECGRHKRADKNAPPDYSTPSQNRCATLAKDRLRLWMREHPIPLDHRFETTGNDSQTSGSEKGLDRLGTIGGDPESH